MAKSGDHYHGMIPKTRPSAMGDEASIEHNTEVAPDYQSNQLDSRHGGKDEATGKVGTEDRVAKIAH